MNQDLYQRLRKRMLMFYFAAGVNLLMALWVMSVPAAQVPSGTKTIVLVIFLAFAWLNFYMARVLRRQWDAHLRKEREGEAQRPESENERVNG